MAASVQTPAPNGTAPRKYLAVAHRFDLHVSETGEERQLTPSSDLKIVDRVNSVPVIHDSIAYAEHLIKSTELTSNLYQTCLNLAARALQTADPVLQRTQPLIQSADNLAVATFDRAESAFPCTSPELRHQSTDR